MVNTILIDILRTFSAEEMKRFGEMTRSPYFNKQTTVAKLFEHIKVYYPDFEDIALKKQNVYAHIFPGKEYNYGSMKNLIYDLQKLSETFIIDQEMKKNDFDVRRSLINSLYGRKLTALSEKNLRELEKDITAKETIDEDNFLKLFNIHKTKRIHIFAAAKGNTNINQKTQTPYYEQLLNATKYLKKYFTLDTLRTYNYIITNKNILNTEKTIKDCELFIAQYNEGEHEELSLKLELMFLKMNLGMITENEFLQFRKLVLSDLHKMKADKSTILAYSIYLLNYCRIKNKFEKKYLIYAFEILKNLSDNDNFISGSGYMNIVLVRNIILIATQLNEFEWCENFLKCYDNKIHPDYRDNIMTFYNAHKKFHERSFDESLECLSKLSFDDIYNKNYIKILMVMNFYELKYFDLLNEQLESYKKFLANNDSLPESYKKDSLKFVGYMNKLLKATSGKKSDLFYLRNSIKSEKELQNKDWLVWMLQKLNELLVRKK
jgi:hypothetical protein